VSNAARGSLTPVWNAFLERPRWASNRSRQHQERSEGFTLIEILICLAIVLTISAIAIPNLLAAVNQARIARAVNEIDTLEDEITVFVVTNGTYPDSLGAIGYGSLLDPWGNPYQYLNHATMRGNGHARKDRFLVPLNSDYDLYSMGKDGASVAPITGQTSLDDVIRASNGSYVGLASQF
jgi:general secretion pathway protein G